MSGIPSECHSITRALNRKVRAVENGACISSNIPYFVWEKIYRTYYRVTRSPQKLADVV
jgi:hypothetical protein